MGKLIKKKEFLKSILAFLEILEKKISPKLNKN